MSSAEVSYTWRPTRQLCLVAAAEESAGIIMVMIHSESAHYQYCYIDVALWLISHLLVG